MTNPLTDRQLGYNSGMRIGKELGRMSGRSEMLAEIIETIEDLGDENLRYHDSKSLATMLWKELQDEN